MLAFILNNVHIETVEKISHHFSQFLNTLEKCLQQLYMKSIWNFYICLSEQRHWYSIWPEWLSTRAWCVWHGMHDDVIKWKHFPRYWPFVRGIHRSPVNSPHKGQWRGALMFTLICARINVWVNNRKAGDLRRYRVHYDVIVMVWQQATSRAQVDPMLAQWTLLSGLLFEWVCILSVSILVDCGRMSYTGQTIHHGHEIALSV